MKPMPILTPISEISSAKFAIIGANNATSKGGVSALEKVGIMPLK
jgi:hypothetical protein